MHAIGNLLVVAALLALLADADLCPSSLLTPTSGSTMSFFNCPVPINVTGTNVANFTLSLTNSPPGVITLSGYVINVSIFVVGSSVNFLQLSIGSTSSVANVSIVLANTTFSATPPAPRSSNILLFVFGTSPLSVDGLYISVVDSTFADMSMTLLQLAAGEFHRLELRLLRSKFLGDHSIMLHLEPERSATSTAISLDRCSMSSLTYFLWVPTGKNGTLWKDFSLAVLQSNITTSYEMMLWAAVGNVMNFSFIALGSRLVAGPLVLFAPSSSSSSSQFSGLIISFLDGTTFVSSSAVYMIVFGDGVDLLSDTRIILSGGSSLHQVASPSSGLLRISGFVPSQPAGGLVDNLSIVCNTSTINFTLGYFISFDQTPAKIRNLAVTLASCQVTIGQLIRSLSVDPVALDLSFLTITLTNNTNFNSSEKSLFMVKRDNVHANATGILIAFHQSQVVVGQVLAISFFNLADVTLVVNQSNVTVLIWDLMRVDQANKIELFAMHILSSNVTSFGNLATLNNISALEVTRVTIENTIAYIEFTGINAWLTNVVGPFSVAVRNSSRIKIVTNVNMNSAFVKVRAVYIFGALFVCSLEDSTVVVTVTASAFYGMALVALSNTTLATQEEDSPIAGAVSVQLVNSSVTLVQSNPTAILDTCCILNMITCVASSPTRIYLNLTNQSVVSISCTHTSSVVLSMESPRLALSLSATDSSMSLNSRAVTFRSTVSGVIEGSFLLLLINSAAEDSSATIRGCSVRCGLICQYTGVQWCDANLYRLFLFSTISYFPPQTNPQVSSSSFSLEHSSIFGIGGDSGLLLPLRSLFEFKNWTRTTATIEGPVQLGDKLFDGIMDGGTSSSAQGGGGGNRLVLRSCERIVVISATEQKEIKLPVRSALAPRGRLGVDVVSIRSGGVGSCATTMTESVEATLTQLPDTRSHSASLTATAHKPAVLGITRPSVARAVMSGGISVVTLTCGAAVAVAVQSLHAQSLLSTCPRGIDTDEAPDFPSSPTQMSIGQGPAAYKRGAVVGNVIILGACAIVAGLAVWCQTAPRTRTTTAAAARLGLPGLLYIPYSILIVPTTTCATAVLAWGTSDVVQGADVAVGLVGFMFALVPATLLFLYCSIWFGGEGVHVKLAKNKRKRTALERELRAWYGSTVDYFDKRMAPGFVARWDYSGMLDFTRSRQWFIAVDLGQGLVTGVLAGLTSLGGAYCNALNIAQCTVTILRLALLLLLTPQKVRADYWISVCSSLLQCLTAVLSALGRDATDAMTWMQLGLSVVYVAGFVAFELSSNGQRTLLRLFRDRRTTTNVWENPGKLDDDLRELLHLYTDEGADHSASGRRAALRLLIEAACSRRHAIKQG